MSAKPLNLVKYAGEYWFTLADFTQTRDTEGYADSSSLKSAIRTFIVRTNQDKYLAFRGEVQLRNIIKENKNNPFFHAEDFKGTRTALIHWSMMDELTKKFAVSEEYRKYMPQFIGDAVKYISECNKDKKEDDLTEESDSSNMIEERSSILRHLRSELQKVEKDIETKQNNREKILQAINAIQSLEI